MDWDWCCGSDPSRPSEPQTPARTETSPASQGAQRAHRFIKYKFKLSAAETTCTSLYVRRAKLLAQGAARATHPLSFFLTERGTQYFSERFRGERAPASSPSCRLSPLGLLRQSDQVHQPRTVPSSAASSRKRRDTRGRLASTRPCLATWRGRHPILKTCLISRGREFTAAISSYKVSDRKGMVHHKSYERFCAFPWRRRETLAI